MKKAKTVDEYISNSPKAIQSKLKELRSLIKKTAPKAEERISYGMPFYEYKGRLVYFAAMKNYIGLYVPPPVIDEHAADLKKYVKTKSAVHLPTEKLPTALIRKLVKARMKHNEAKSKIK